MRTSLACLSIVFLSTAVQPASPEILTLESAVQQALAGNPSLQVQKERIPEAQAQKRLAISNLLPQVDLSGSAGVGRDPANGRNVLFGGDAYNRYRFELTATQPLFNWGIISGIRIPERDIELRALDVEITERRLTGLVVIAFYDLIVAQRNLELLNRTKTLQGEALTATERRYRIGRSQKIDLLQAQTQLALLASRIAQAKTRIQVAAIRLANLLGKPDIQNIHIQGSLLAPTFAKVQPLVETESMRFPQVETVRVTRERLQNEKNVVFGQNLPQLSLLATWGRSSFVGSDLLDSTSTSWLVGAELSIPIFSGLSSFREREIFASRLQQIDFQEQDITNTISLEQSQALQNLTLTEETVRSAQEALALSESSLEEGQRNYRLATIDFLQFLSIQEAHVNASVTHNNAQHDYILALLNYFQSSGLPLPRLVQILGGSP